MVGLLLSTLTALKHSTPREAQHTKQTSGVGVCTGASVLDLSWFECTIMWYGDQVGSGYHFGPHFCTSYLLCVVLQLRFLLFGGL